MSAQIIAERFRVFLLSVAAFMCAGIVIELLLANHVQEPIQFVPFVLCALALITIVAVLWKPQFATIWTMRVVMGALVLGSLVGVYEHLQSNWEIVLETKPNLATAEMFWTAVRGAAPLLAPGILVLVALLAVAATYYHPVLGERQSI
jgi:hypothetical protein